MLIPPAPAPAPVQSVPIEALPDFLVLLRSLVFWIGLSLLVIYVLIQFFRLRSLHIAGLRKYPLITWFLNLWGALITWLKQTRRSADIFLRKQPWRTRPGAAPHPPMSDDRWSYLGLRRLSARQRVVFYYLAMVRRGGESGIPRQPAQTPSEYAAQLSQELDALDSSSISQPAAAEDIQVITDRFVEARYSQHPISGDQAERVKNIWMRLRKLLQRSPSLQRDR